jgi:hypothetical protein
MGERSTGSEGELAEAIWLGCENTDQVRGVRGMGRTRR